MRKVAFLAVALLFAAPVAAQAGEVAGTVYDARGRASAGVQLVLGGQQVVSGADGTYRFTDVAPGEHSVTAGSQRLSVAVTETGETRRNIVLLSRSARLAVTGDVVPPASTDAVLVQAMQLADAMLAEAAGLPERRLPQIDG